MSLKKLLVGFVMVALPLLASAAFPTYTLRPASGTVKDAGTFKNVQLQFNEKITVDATKLPTLENNETGDVYTADSFEFWLWAYNFDGSNIVRIVFPEVEDNGEYTMHIPAESMSTESGDKNAAIEVKYTIDDETLVKKTYNPITINSVSPAQNASLAMFGNNLKVTFQTSDNSAVNFLTWEFWDMESLEPGTEQGQPVLVRQNNRNRYTLNGNMLASSPVDQWTNGIDIIAGGVTKLYEGKHYQLRVKFYAEGLTPADVANGVRNALPGPDVYEKSLLAEYTVDWNGSTPMYQYSPVTFTVSPDPDTYVIDNPELAVFTFTYSAPVDVNHFEISLGMGSSASGGTAVPNEDKTVWTLTLNPTQVQENMGEGFLTWSVGANDMEGRRVRGNGSWEAGASDIMTYSTLCDNTTPRLVLVEPQDTEEIPSISSITIGNTAGKNMIQGYSKQAATIVNRQGEVIRELERPTQDADNPAQAVFTLDEPITETGSYILMVPSNYFAFGAAADALYSLHFEQEFYVKSASDAIATDLTPIEYTPAADSTVKELQVVSLTFDEDIDLPQYEEDNYVYNPKKVALYRDNVLLEEAYPAFDNKDWNVAKITFSKLYTEKGNYRIDVEEGTISNMAYEESNRQSGRINPAFSINYNIGGTTGIDSVEAENYSGPVYSIDGVMVKSNATLSDVKALPAGLYIFNQKKVVVK